MLNIEKLFRELFHRVTSRVPTADFSYSVFLICQISRFPNSVFSDFDVTTHRAPVLVAIAMVERGIDAISAVTLIRSKR